MTQESQWNSRNSAEDNLDLSDIPLVWAPINPFIDMVDSFRERLLWVTPVFLKLSPEIVDENSTITEVINWMIQNLHSVEYIWSKLVKDLLVKLQLIQDFLSQWDDRKIITEKGAVGYECRLYSNWIYHNQYDRSSLTFDYDELRFMILYQTWRPNVSDIWSEDELKNIIQYSSPRIRSNILRWWWDQEFTIKTNKWKTDMVFNKQSEIIWSEILTKRIHLTIDMILDLQCL